MSSRKNDEIFSVMRFKEIRFIKIVAIVVAVLFFQQQISWAQGGSVPVKSAVSQPVYDAKGIENSSMDFEVPSHLAGTSEIFSGGIDEKIIHIQDAHASLSAQYSIVELLDSLVTKYDLDFVALEGAEGYLDAALLRTFPDKEIRKNTADYLMKKGLMGAGEFFAVTNDKKDIALYGIEDQELYDKNLKEFREVVDERNELIDVVNAVMGQIKALEESVYSPDMFLLNENAMLHRTGDISFSEYWKNIREVADKTGVDVNKYEELVKLFKTIELEKEIDFLEANIERRRLISELNENMKKKELEALVFNAVAFRENKISKTDFHRYLVALAENNNIPQEEYQNLRMFTSYISLYENIDIVRLHHELFLAEEDIRGKLYKNDDEKKVYEVAIMIFMLKRLYSMELTNGDLGVIKRYENEYDPVKLADLIKNKCAKYGVVVKGGYDLGKMLSGMEKAMGFYATAAKRDKAMIDNTVSNMRAEGKKIGALITGGYHTKGLTGIMQKKDISYMVIVPKFEDGKERPYIAVLTNKIKPYQKLLDSGRYQIAANAYLQATGGDPEKIKGTVFFNLAQDRLKGRRDTLDAKNMWLEAFSMVKRSFERLETMTYDRLSVEDFKEILDATDVEKIGRTAVVVYKGVIAMAVEKTKEGYAPVPITANMRKQVKNRFMTSTGEVGEVGGEFAGGKLVETDIEEIIPKLNSKDLIKEIASQLVEGAKRKLKVTDRKILSKLNAKGINLSPKFKHNKKHSVQIALFLQEVRSKAREIIAAEVSVNVKVPAITKQKTQKQKKLESKVSVAQAETARDYSPTVVDKVKVVASKIWGVGKRAFDPVVVGALAGVAFFPALGWTAENAIRASDVSLLASYIFTEGLVLIVVGTILFYLSRELISDKNVEIAKGLKISRRTTLLWISVFMAWLLFPSLGKAATPAVTIPADAPWIIQKHPSSTGVSDIRYDGNKKGTIVSLNMNSGESGSHQGEIFLEPVHSNIKGLSRSNVDLYNRTVTIEMVFPEEYVGNYVQWFAKEDKGWTSDYGTGVTIDKAGRTFISYTFNRSMAKDIRIFGLKFGGSKKVSGKVLLGQIAISRPGEGAVKLEPSLPESLSDVGEGESESLLAEGPIDLELKKDGFYWNGKRTTLPGTNWRVLGQYGYSFGHGNVKPWYKKPVGVYKYRSRVEEDFKAIKKAGLKKVRVWLLDDGRAILDKEGNVVAYDEVFRRDVKTFLDLASKYGVAVEFTILDYLIAGKSKNSNGVWVQGRRKVFTDPAVRRGLINNFVVPLVKEFGTHPAFKIIDLGNELEWLVSPEEGGGWDTITDMGTRDVPVPLKDLKAYLKETSAAIRKHAPGLLITGGFNSVSHPGLYEHVRPHVDYIAAHYYPKFGPRRELLMEAKNIAKCDECQIHLQVCLEEYPSKSIELDKMLVESHEMGYMGADFWNYVPSIDDQTADASDMAKGLRKLKDLIKNNPALYSIPLVTGMVTLMMPALGWTQEVAMETPSLVQSLGGMFIFISAVAAIYYLLKGWKELFELKKIGKEYRKEKKAKGDDEEVTRPSGFKERLWNASVKVFAGLGFVLVSFVVSALSTIVGGETSSLGQLTMSWLMELGVIQMGGIILAIFVGFKIKDAVVARREYNKRKHLRSIPVGSADGAITARKKIKDFQIVVGVPQDVYNFMGEKVLKKLLRPTGVDKIIGIRDTKKVLMKVKGGKPAQRPIEDILKELENRTKGARTICAFMDKDILEEALVLNSNGMTVDVDVYKIKNIVYHFGASAARKIINIADPGNANLSFEEVKKILSDIQDDCYLAYMLEIQARFVEDIESLGLLEKSAYDMDFNRVNDQVLSKVTMTKDAARFVQDNFEKNESKYISVAAKSAADLRFLASGIRKMGLGDHAVKKFIHVRIRNDNIDEKNLEKYLKNTGLSTYLTRDNISIVEGSDMTLEKTLKIVQNKFHRKYRDDVSYENIVIGDSEDLIQGDKDHEIISGEKAPVFVYMKGTGLASQMLWVLVEIMAHRDNLKDIPAALGDVGTIGESGNWYIYLPNIKMIDLDKLKEKIKNYESLLSAA